MPNSSFTAILEKEEDMYVSLCPEIDIASQGNSSFLCFFHCHFYRIRLKSGNKRLGDMNNSIDFTAFLQFYHIA